MPDADPGLFGPDSMTWRVHGELVVAVAGLRALLLQALQPDAIAILLRHSDFRADPWGRLARTAEYIGVTTFGTTSEAQRAAARVRGVHRRLARLDAERSIPGPALDDPELLTWIHCCEAESMWTTYARCGARIGPGDADRYYGEQRRSAELVGLDPLAVPATAQEMASYFRRVRPGLRAGPDARRAARFVLAPPMPARVRWLTPAALGWGALATLSAGLLPAWARRLYGLPGLPPGDVAAVTALRALRLGLLAVPAPVRQGPHRRQALARLAPAG